MNIMSRPDKSTAVIQTSQDAGSLVRRDFSEVEIAALQRMRQRPANTQRAIDSDLGYIHTWCLAATGEQLPLPADPELAVKFLAHHFGGMPSEVLEALARLAPTRLAKGKLAPTTVKRMVTTWRVEHDRRGIENPLKHQAFGRLLRDALRTSDERPGRKSRKAVMRPEMQAILATEAPETDQGAPLRDLRDRAMLLFAFSSGGRRRSEVSNLRCENLERHDLPEDGGGTALTFRVYLGRTKTTSAKDAAWVELSGTAALVMEEWLKTAAIDQGPVFRKIDQWGKLSRDAMTPEGINYVLKRRISLAGLNVRDFSAHGLRSGFITQCGRDGINLQEAMEMSLHRDARTAMRYFKDGQLGKRRAARLIDVAIPSVVRSQKDVEE